MKPSEVIKSLSPNGYVDTELLYNSDYPNIMDIVSLVKVGVPLSVIDKLHKYNSVDTYEVESNMSLIKSIEHPSQIIGGYAFSEELADTISSYFGREVLLSLGRPVNKRNYYSKDELTSNVFLEAALKRLDNYPTYTFIKRLVPYNKEYSRDLESAKYAFQLKKTFASEVLERFNNETLNTPCGAVLFTRDNALSLDAFSAMLSCYGRDLKQGNQILLDIPVDVNEEYKKHRVGRESVPYYYTKASGRTLSVLFDVSIEENVEPDNWEIINTMENSPIYVGKCNDKKVVTIFSLSNEEVMNKINNKIDRINKSYSCNMKHILLSNIGDFFYPTVYAVHC